MERIKDQIRKRGLKKWVPLIVLASALMIIIIDTTVLNVSIRNMIDDLGTTVQGIQWVISAYSLTLAALTVTGGRLGDLFGRKRMFMIGAVLFALGSFVTSIAPSIAWVIIGNALIEGVGAALMMPATAALLVNHYKGKDRALAFAIWGSVAAVAASIGPILGGWLTTNYSWRWAFRINLVIVVLLLLGARLLQEAHDRTEKIELDGIGILLSSTGLTALVYGLIESSTYGWWMAKQPFAILGQNFAPFGLSVTPVAIALGLVLLGLFVWYEDRHEKRGHTPLVNLGLFKNRQFTSGSLTTAMLAMGQTGLVFAIPIFLQSVRGYDALRTGLGLVPMSLAIMVGAPLGLKLSNKLLPKQVIQLGFVISLTGILYMYLSLGIDSTPLTLAPGMALYGLGTGFGFSQLGNLTLSAVSVEQSGEASGVNNTIRQIGASFGSAVIGAVLIATLATGVFNRISNNTNIPEQYQAGILAAAKEAGSNIELVRPTGHDSLPQQVQEEVSRSIHEATVDGNKMALAFTGGFVLLALVVSNSLPGIRNLETGVSATDRQPAAAH